MRLEPKFFVAEDRLLLVSVAKTIEQNSVYDAARYAWPVNRHRVETSIDFVLACVGGVVKGVFVPTQWLDASPGEPTRTNFPGFIAAHKGRRLGFVGYEANEDALRRYLEKRVPQGLRIGQKGFRYSEEA